MNHIPQPDSSSDTAAKPSRIPSVPKPVKDGLLFIGGAALFIFGITMASGAAVATSRKVFGVDLAPTPEKL